MNNLLRNDVLTSEMDNYAIANTPWENIPFDIRVSMCGIAAESIPLADIIDFVCNADSLENPILSTIRHMKTSKGLVNVVTDMESLLLELLMPKVHDMYEELAFMYLAESKDAAGYYSGTDLQTGELEWKRRYA